MILVIGNSSSQEFEGYKAVSTAVLSRGEKMILFRQDRALEGEYMTFGVVNGELVYYLEIQGELYPLSMFDAVWYMHPQIPKSLLAYEPVEHRQFISAQFHEQRRAIWHLLRDKRWINDPWLTLEAESKVFQLTLAKKVGFEVPETVITSNPERVRGFYARCGGDIITKILSLSPILDHVIYTTPVSVEDMKEIDSVKFAPAIFQARVKKSYELRITVVGSRIFPVKIYSQEDESTSIDWRTKPKFNDFHVRMEQTILPNAVVSRILSFMKLIRLRYGSIDMIVTPEGEYVFLEINPSGQWYFVQLHTGAQIADAIADLLVP